MEMNGSCCCEKERERERRGKENNTQNKVK